MEVLSLLQRSWRFFSISFIPLFVIMGFFPVVSMVLRPVLNQYLILDTLTLFDLFNIFWTLLLGGISFIAIDTLFHFKTLIWKELFNKALDVIWPLFLFELIWLLIGGVVLAFSAAPVILFFLLLIALIFISVRTSLATVLIIVEKESVAKAFDRSFLLTRDHFWQLLGIVTLLAIVVILLFIVLFTLIIQPIFNIKDVNTFYELLPNHLGLEFMFSVILATIVSQLFSITLYMIYQELIVDKNAVSDELVKS